jgi:hypothetical protein
MSESEPAPVADEASDTETEDVEEEADEDDEDKEDEEAEVCGHLIGNGECQLAPGHDGQHRINV